MYFARQKKGLFEVCLYFAEGGFKKSQFTNEVLFCV